MGSELAIYGPQGDVISGHLPGEDPPSVPTRQGILIDNRTGLSDAEVEAGIKTYFNENAAALGVGRGRLDSFTTQTYSGDGSLLNRTKFAPPTNVIEEITLARELAEKDDDIAPAIDLMIAAAFEAGMENNHPDEQTRVLFNQIAKKMDLDAQLAELYREWLIAGQVTTVHWFSGQNFTFTPEGGDGRSRKDFRLAVPTMGVLPAERIRLIGSDMFGTAQLAYLPGDEETAMKTWLDEFLSDTTPPARKNAMKAEDPVSAALFVERVILTSDEQTVLGAQADAVYLMNQKLVARSTRAKGAWQHPRPLITRSFPLLEAKRLLNLLDHSLLQGGINFLVVAKKGSEQFRATPNELASLNEAMQRASRSGVVVGDHRLNIEIITPKMEAMLSPERRQLIGRKLANAILRLPEATAQQAGQEAMKAALEFLPRIISADRLRLRRHVENKVYDEIVSRNKQAFGFGAPSLWFPKIIMAGTQYFTDYQVKMYDRGLLSKKALVDGGGYSYEVELQQRTIETERGDDETMQIPETPGGSNQADAPDNGPGRPPGTSPNNGAPGARTAPQARPAIDRAMRDRGEAVTLVFEEHAQEATRIGEITRTILDEYAGTWEVGRISPGERVQLESRKSGTHGKQHFIHVNTGYDIVDERAVRLGGGATLYTGRRKRDRAIVALALGFRDTHFTMESAVKAAEGWGFRVGEIDVSDDDQ